MLRGSAKTSRKRERMLGEKIALGFERAGHGMSVRWMGVGKGQVTARKMEDRGEAVKEWVLSCCESHE